MLQGMRAELVTLGYDESSVEDMEAWEVRDRLGVEHDHVTTHAQGQHIRAVSDALSGLIGARKQAITSAMAKAMRSIPHDKREDAIQSLSAYLLERADRIRAAENKESYLWTCVTSFIGQAYHRKGGDLALLELRLGRANPHGEYAVPESLDAMIEIGQDVADNRSRVQHDKAITAYVHSLPTGIQEAARKLCEGEVLTNSERANLSRFRKVYGKLQVWKLPVAA